MLKTTSEHCVCGRPWPKYLEYILFYRLGVEDVVITLLPQMEELWPERLSRYPDTQHS